MEIEMVELNTFDGKVVDFFETVEKMDNLDREIKLLKAVGKDTKKFEKEKQYLVDILDYNGICGI